MFAVEKELSGRDRLETGEREGMAGGGFPPERGGKEIKSPNMAAHMEGASQDLYWMNSGGSEQLPTLLSSQYESLGGK